MKTFVCRLRTVPLRIGLASFFLLAAISFVFLSTPLVSYAAPKPDPVKFHNNQFDKQNKKYQKDAKNGNTKKAINDARKAVKEAKKAWNDAINKAKNTTQKNKLKQGLNKYTAQQKKEEKKRKDIENGKATLGKDGKAKYKK